jgi:MoxR-like ATPase
MDIFAGIEDLQDALLRQGYLAGRALAAPVFLAGRLGKPLLVEGPAGVGKTDLAGVLAGAMGTELIRLQCYPGLDQAGALYEWNYQQQLLYIQARQGTCAGWQELKQDIYTPEFLLRRPLLKAFLAERPVVLLIDEVDKSDDELESFLLEALSDFQVSIPELGTVRARSTPFVLLTSNNSREFGDALKRRCLYLYIPYPGAEQERAIVELKVQGISRQLAGQVVEFVQTLRRVALKKCPSIAETLDWSRTLVMFNKDRLDPEVVNDTLGTILKYQEDIAEIQKKLPGLLPEDCQTRPVKRTAAGRPDGRKANKQDDEVNLGRFDF